MLNQDLRDNPAFLANPPACRVYHNADQSFADAARATAAFNSERYDTAAMHDTVTNNSRITMPVAGLYLVTFNGHFIGSSDYNLVDCEIRLNGATTIAVSNSLQHNVITAAPRLVVAFVYKYAAGDYVEARPYQDNTSAAARNLQAVGNYSPEFSATWIGLG
jgi:hypothetical protein